jgi:hypothetical protein
VPKHSRKTNNTMILGVNAVFIFFIDRPTLAIQARHPR